MTLETVPEKYLNELEHKVKELLALMRKAKFKDEDLINALKQLELELGTARRERFDAANPTNTGLLW
jgi:hypothetical protein